MRVKLDKNKVIYDGTSLIVVYSEKELKKKFKKLKGSFKK